MVLDDDIPFVILPWRKKVGSPVAQTRLPNF
jgi:hypothetical protein